MNSKSKYLSSAFILLLSSVIVKALGAVYKIPLTSYIGAVGRGYFATAYNLCLPVHAIILGSLPVALSRLIAKYNAKGNNIMLLSLKKSAFHIFFIVGVSGTVLVMALAKPYSLLVTGSEKSIYTILVLAPSIFFSSVSASYEDYYEGLMNMKPTAISQLIDAFFKMVFGLIFAKYSMVYLFNHYLQFGTVFGAVVNNDADALSVIYPITSAFAMLGAVLGSFASYIYIFIYDLINRNKKINKNELKIKLARREMLSFAFPIMMSCSVQSVFQFLDTATIQYSLKTIEPSVLQNAYSFSNVSAQDLPTYVYGLFSTSLDFKNLIPGVTMVLGVCAVPAISRECELKNSQHLSILINSIYKYTILLSIFGGVVLSAYSSDILNLFYSSSSPDIIVGSNSLVKGFAFSIVFYCLAGTAVSSVQAIGCPQKSILPYVVSGVIRVALNLILVKNEKLILIGAVVSGTVGYFVMCIMNIHIVSKQTNTKFDFKNNIIKPLSIYLVAYFLSKNINNFVHFSTSLLVNLTIKIILSFIITILLCFLLKTLNFSEFFLHKRE